MAPSTVLFDDHSPFIAGNFHRVLALVIPASFFAALDRSASGAEGSEPQLINDHIRNEFMRISRGFAVILLVV